MAHALEDQLAKLKEKAREIHAAMDERNRMRTIQCRSCNDAHAIGVLTAIQTHFYISPSGHIEGDYWLKGEMQFVCPTNGVVNRLLFDTNDVPWDERKNYENDPEAQFREMYLKLFSNVREVYEEGPAREKWVNNCYVDKNREEFGLVAKRK